jgi:2-C-methyl-D-erythritol 2,4-cyclodiphosphate synthase
MGLRIGNGFDSHRFASGRPLMLGGVHVPNDAGLEGHSDGDCLVHAICDALLGALAAGDLGTYFPSSDPRWAGSSSLVFLEDVGRMVAEKGFSIENIDSTVIAEVPVLVLHVGEMRETVSRSLGIAMELVSVKAKTADQMGALGRSEGIAAHATVLLRSQATAQ